MLLMTVSANAAWFSKQGFNLSECGPTAGKNAAVFAGKQATRFTARKFNPSRKYWRLVDIKAYLDFKGVQSSMESTAGITGKKLKGDKLGIFYNGHHFYIYHNGKVWDSLYGVWSASLPEHVGGKYIRVTR